MNFYVGAYAELTMPEITVKTPVKRCPVCSSRRWPSDVKFCGDCGKSFNDTFDSLTRTMNMEDIEETAPGIFKDVMLDVMQEDDKLTLIGNFCNVGDRVNIDSQETTKKEIKAANVLDMMTKFEEKYAKQLNVLYDFEVNVKFGAITYYL